MSSEVVKFNKQKRRRLSARVLAPIDQASGAARYYNRMMKDVETDLGGKRFLSRIEHELIAAFCGCATRLEYLNHQILLGDDSDVDLASFSQLASTMLRIGSRLGFARRARDCTPTLDEIAREIAAEKEVADA